MGYRNCSLVRTKGKKSLLIQKILTGLGLTQTSSWGVDKKNQLDVTFVFFISF